MLNCPNCGAPISGTYCSYCGTEFKELNDIQERMIEIQLNIANAQMQQYIIETLYRNGIRYA